MNNWYDWATPHRLTQIQKGLGAENVNFVPHTLSFDNRVDAGGTGTGSAAGGLSPEFAIATPPDGPWFWFGTRHSRVNLDPPLGVLWRVKLLRSNRWLGRHMRTPADPDHGWMPLLSTSGSMQTQAFDWPFPVAFAPNDHFTIQWADPRAPGPPEIGQLLVAFYGVKALIYGREVA